MQLKSDVSGLLLQERPARKPLQQVFATSRNSKGSATLTVDVLENSPYGGGGDNVVFPGISVAQDQQTTSTNQTSQAENLQSHRVIQAIRTSKAKNMPQLKPMIHSKVEQQFSPLKDIQKA